MDRESLRRETSGLSPARAGQRDKAIDSLKSIAIVSVIIIHVTSYGWDVYSINSAGWIINMMWACLARPAVPVFLMCSGALMLAPERALPTRKLFLKNLPRIILSMLVWAMAYKVYAIGAGGDLTFAALIQGAKEVLVFNQEFHFYYIHMTILVYVCLPVTRLIVARGERRLSEYCLALWFIFGVIYPTAINFWPFYLISGFARQWMLNMTYASIGYGMLGFYIRRVASGAGTRKWHALSLGFGFCLAFFGTWIICVRANAFADAFLGGMSVGVAFMATGIFGLVSAAYPAADAAPASDTVPDFDTAPAFDAAPASDTKKKNPAPKRGLTKEAIAKTTKYLSDASFCVYLAHVFFLRVLENAGWFSGWMSPVLFAPLTAAGILFASLLVYAVLSRIPIVNRWLI